MAEQETYNPYTLADIERYLQGKMTAAEMHAMEKAALQDPFLSDAIEGYSKAPLNTAKTHLNEIAAALSAGKEEARVVTMPVKKRSWVNWGVAAAAVAVVAALLFITGPKKERQSNLAAKQTNMPVFTDTVKNYQPAPADTAQATGDIAVTYNAGKKKELNKGSATVISTESNSYSIATNDSPLFSKPVEKTMAYEPLASKDSTPGLSKDLAFNRAMALNKNKSIGNGYYYNSVDNNRLSNNVIFLNKQSGPSYQQNINIQPIAANTVTATTISAHSSTDSLNVALKGYVAGINVTPQPNKEIFLTTETADAKARKSAAPMKIVLTPIPNFDTVAITYLNNKNKSPKMVVDSSLSPKGGWESFRDYVVKRLDKKADTSELAEGDVELEFTIDDRGIAKDIKITRSLDMEHDAKAADFVKQWPGWITTKKQKKGKVVIQF